MARLRRWNIINKSEDCEPDDGAAIGHEAGKGGAGAGVATRALQIKALKVRPWWPGRLVGSGYVCIKP